MEKKLTEMEIFALEFLMGKGEVYPAYMGKEWNFKKHGRWYVSSRMCFGVTSAAYKCLRGLAKKGLVNEHRYGSGFSSVTYSAKEVETHNYQ